MFDICRSSSERLLASPPLIVSALWFLGMTARGRMAHKGGLVGESLFGARTFCFMGALLPLAQFFHGLGLVCSELGWMVV